MEVYKYIAWRVDLTSVDSAFSCFSKKTAKKIRSSLNRFAESPYKFDIVPVTDALLDSFVIRYRENIRNKHNGRIFDVKNIIKERQKLRPYYMLTLFNEDEFCGAMIFSLIDNFVSIAFKVFPLSLDGVLLSININFLAEYFLFDWAINEGKDYVRHGKDSNVYGINSNPGLATFKLQIGAKPYISDSKQEILNIELPEENGRDVLIFEGKGENEFCDKAYLHLYVTDNEDVQSTYGALLKSGLDVEIIDKNI